jgi:glycosyltransferase involved in cell wall biosynthesis
MKKSIAIDCSKLNTSYKTGTHRFLIGFLNELVKNKEYDFTFLVKENGKFLEEFDFFKLGKVLEIKSGLFYTQFGLLGILNKFDYIVFPWQTLPFLGFFSSGKKVSIIHDTGFNSTSKLTTFLTQIFSDQIFSVSLSTAKDLLRQSTVIGEGVDEKIFFPVSSRVLKEYSSKLDLPNFYILSLGRIEKRKNIYNNLKAFSEVKKYYPNLKYLFIGNFVENEEIIYSFIKSLNLSEGDVVFKKNVSDSDLNIYLNNMEFLVFTSFDEGFGLPVLEAYAVQKPVLLSKIQQLAEFKISAKQFVDPKDVSKIAEKMIKFLQGETGIESKKQYKEILNKFSWSKSAQVFLKSLK